MKQDLLYIEADRALFRGFGRLWPVLAWDAAAGIWIQHDGANPQPESWGELVTPREAERLFPNSTSARPPAGVATSADLDGQELIRYRPELFDGYDGPVFRKSPEEQAELYAYFQSLRPAKD
jgi:hypothetical protein